MSPVEQTPRIGAQDELTGVDQTLFTTTPDPAETKPVEKKNTLHLPPPSLAHMPMTAYFRPDDPALIAVLLEQKRQLEALSRRDIAQVVILGLAYSNPGLERNVALIARDFLITLRSGQSFVAETEFRMLAPELQQAVLQEMLVQAGVNETSGFSAQQKDLRAFCETIVPLLRQATPEFREQLLALLAQQDNWQAISGSLERLQSTLSQFSQKMQSVFGASDMRSLSRDISELAVALEKPELKERFMQVCQLLEMTDVALGRLEYEYDSGALTNEDLEENINTLVLVLDTSVQDFLVSFEALTNAPQQTSEISSSFQLAQDVRFRLVQEQDQVNKKVADLVTAVYERSAGKTVIKLDLEVYGLINLSLQRLKDQGAEVTLLPMMFCERQATAMTETADLDFLKGSYEISNAQTLNNFSIAIRYLYEQVLQKDKAQRLENREQLLKDLREIEKFLVELKEKIKMFYKRLTDIQQKNKLEKVYTAVTLYTQLIAALKAETTEGKPFGQRSVFTVAWFEEALNTERWKKTVQVLMGIMA